MNHPRIILASKSPRRAILLKQIGLKFHVHPSRVNEDFHRSSSPAKNVVRIALQKAQDIARHYRSGIVIGADTIVVLKRRMMGKPSSAKEAKQMLKRLSGREHVVYTGFAMVDASTGKTKASYEKTKVQFRRLTGQEISTYVASGSPMDKAGAYGIQDDFGAVFVEKVDGCFYNVVGFPLPKFYTMFQSFLRHTNSDR